MSVNPLGLALDAHPAAISSAALLFLACPYSHPDRMIRAQRALVASEAAARLITAGYAVFSPISHGHAVCEADITASVGTDAQTWAVVNDAVLTGCNALVALDIPGLWQSAGVRREAGMAKTWGLPINLIRFAGNELEVEAGVDPMLFSDSKGRL